MAHPAVRFALAVVAGVIAAGLVIGGVEAIGHAIFPPPAGLDLNRQADLDRLMAVMPTGAKAMVILAWFLGAVAGASLAIVIGKRILPAWIVGLAIAALGLWTTQMFPHPAWMVASALALPLIAVVVAKGLMRRHLAGAEPRTAR